MIRAGRRVSGRPSVGERRPDPSLLSGPPRPGRLRLAPVPVRRRQCEREVNLQIPVRAIVIAFILFPFESSADAVAIPLAERGASTLYVQVDVEGAGARDFLVDTGSSYSSIGPGTLDVLEKRGMATFVRRVGGTMADGSRRYVPIYSIDGLTVGDRCRLDDVKVAVLPGRERPILGVNALRRLAPITFSMDPPALQPGRCRQDAPADERTASADS